jgi:hypothetical protein
LRRDAGWTVMRCFGGILARFERWIGGMGEVGAAGLEETWTKAPRAELGMDVPSQVIWY